MTPLRYVVAQLAVQQRQLDTLDTRISQQLQEIEHHIRARGVARVCAVRLPDGAELAWSGAIRDRSSRRAAPADRWRLVIRDVDGSVADLLSSSREERSEVLITGALSKLVHQLLGATA